MKRNDKLHCFEAVVLFSVSVLRGYLQYCGFRSLEVKKNTHLHNILFHLDVFSFDLEEVRFMLWIMVDVGGGGITAMRSSVVNIPKLKTGYCGVE